MSVCEPTAELGSCEVEAFGKLPSQYIGVLELLDGLVGNDLDHALVDGVASLLSRQVAGTNQVPEHGVVHLPISEQFICRKPGERLAPCQCLGFLNAELECVEPSIAWTAGDPTHLACNDGFEDRSDRGVGPFADPIEPYKSLGGSGRGVAASSNLVRSTSRSVLPNLYFLELLDA